MNVVAHGFAYSNKSKSVYVDRQIWDLTSGGFINSIFRKTPFNLLSADGRVLSGISKGQMSSGQHTLNMDMSTRPSGVYFVQCRVNNREYQNKIVLTR